MTKTTAYLSGFRRFVHARTRLMISLAAGLALFLLLPKDMRIETRGLLGWDMAAWGYIVTMLRMIAKSTLDTCYARAA